MAFADLVFLMAYKNMAEYSLRAADWNVIWVTREMKGKIEENGLVGNSTQIGMCTTAADVLIAVPKHW
jgi:hypothetical protein